MSKNLKANLWRIFAVVFLIVCGIWFFSSELKHIEDTNGPDVLTLGSITDADIINLDTGALSPVKVSRSDITIGGVDLNASVKLSSQKFTGVYEVLYENYVLPSDFVLQLSSFEVMSGNFKMVVVHDDKIVATIEPGMQVDYRLDNVTGYVSLRIAGESAAYQFYMLKQDYDSFSHS